MTSSAHRAGVKPVTPTLRLQRVSEGDTLIVRLLSADYGGCMTHWLKGRGSVYCPPDTASCREHKRESFWKGYCFAQRFDEESNLWIGCCLELTEHLEEAMRGVYARGQVWELTRAHPVDGKKQPVCGELLETVAQATLPKVKLADLQPCLCAVYHTGEVRLDRKNPLPKRVVVEPQADAPPAKIAARQRRAKLIEQYTEGGLAGTINGILTGRIRPGKYPDIEAFIAEESARANGSGNGNGQH